MSQYIEKDSEARVDITFYCGYRGGAPYALITFPDGTKYSTDEASVPTFFDQVPDQHIELKVFLPSDEFYRADPPSQALQERLAALAVPAAEPTPEPVVEAIADTKDDSPEAD